MVQPDLCLPGTGGDLGWDVLAVGGDPLGEAGGVLIVPSGLDQQAPGVAVAGLGDVAAVLLIAGGVLTRSKPVMPTSA